MPRTCKKRVGPKIQIQKPVSDWILTQSAGTEFTVKSIHNSIPVIQQCNHDSVRKAVRSLIGLLCREINPGSPDGRTPAIYAVLSEAELESGMDELAYKKRRNKAYHKQGYEPGIPKLFAQPELWNVCNWWILESQIESIQEPRSRPKQLTSEQWVLHVVWSILAARKFFKHQIPLGGSLGDKGVRLLA